MSVSLALMLKDTIGFQLDRAKGLSGNDKEAYVESAKKLQAELDALTKNNEEVEPVSPIPFAVMSPPKPALKVYSVLDTTAAVAGVVVREYGASDTDLSGDVVTELVESSVYTMVVPFVDTNGDYSGSSAFDVRGLTCSHGTITFVEHIAGTANNLFKLTTNAVTADTSAVFEWGVHESPGVNLVLATTNYPLNDNGIVSVAGSLPAGWPAIQSSLASPSDAYAGQSQPARLSVLTESTGVPFRRISDASQGYPFAYDVHKYSRLPAYSASGDWIEIGGCCNPTDTMAKGVAFLNSGDSTWGWSTDHHYGFDYDTGRLYRSGPSNANRTLLRDFGSKSTIGQGEGTLSADDRYVLIVTGGTNQLYDIQTNTIVGTSGTVNNQNWASVSLSGQYVVAEENNGSFPRRWWRYNRDMTDRTLIAAYTAQTSSAEHIIEHAAFIVDEFGDDWLVNIGVPFTAVRLKDAARLIFSQGYFGHVSGGLLDAGLQGWCEVGENSGRCAAIKIEIDGAATGTRTISDSGFTTTFSVYNATNKYVTFGLTRSGVATYEEHAKASISRDGKRLVYTSRWNASATRADYEMDLS